MLINSTDGISQLLMTANDNNTQKSWSSQLETGSKPSFICSVILTRSPFLHP